MRSASTMPLSIDTAAPMAAAEPSPVDFASHSRASSGGSEVPTPSTPTFSLPDQSRLAGSVSSLSSTPPCDRMDSPTLPGKSILHDLVEDPLELEEQVDPEGPCRAPSFSNDESDFYSPWSSQLLQHESCDYDLSDGFRSETDCPNSPKKRREPTEPEFPVHTLKARISQRIPSLSRKLRDKRSFSNLSFHGVRSAPISRAPSIRSPSASKSVASAVDVTDPAADSPPVPAVPSHHMQTGPATSSEIHLPATAQDPIDRKALSSTPLLPPSMMGRRSSEGDTIQSPLQSPSVADSPAFAFPSPESSATTTPMASTVHSPSLSCKASSASITASRSSQVRTSVELPTTIDKLHAGLLDEWADKLGHANFDILPVPYTPMTCDLLACKALTADWESARRQYFAHAQRISDEYGPTSTTFRLTGEKWAAIDTQWKHNFNLTVARAKSCGIDVDVVPCLSECAALAKLPSIDNPDSKAKWLNLADNGEIVGPMVTYVSRIKPQSKMSAFRRFFTDLRIST